MELSVLFGVNTVMNLKKFSDVQMFLTVSAAANIWTTSLDNFADVFVWYTHRNGLFLSNRTDQNPNYKYINMIQVERKAERKAYMFTFDIM